MSKMIDMTGWIMKEHGVPNSKLTVLEYVSAQQINKTSKHTYWKCKCECGNICVYRSQDLRKGIKIGCNKCTNHRQRKNTSQKQRKITPNKYDLSSYSFNYGICYLPNGDQCLFDLEDYDKIKNYRWYKHNRGYVCADLPNDKNGKRRHILMHVLLMGKKTGLDIDHINGIKTDNRKHNLRFITRSQNIFNKQSPHGNNDITGVHFDKTRKKWMAYINYDKKRVYLGRFESKEEAISARKAAEEKYYPNFEHVNLNKKNKKRKLKCQIT